MLGRYQGGGNTPADTSQRQRQVRAKLHAVVMAASCSRPICPPGARPRVRRSFFVAGIAPPPVRAAVPWHRFLLVQFVLHAAPLAAFFFSFSFLSVRLLPARRCRPAAGLRRTHHFLQRAANAPLPKNGSARPWTLNAKHRSHFLHREFFKVIKSQHLLLFSGTRRSPGPAFASSRSACSGKTACFRALGR